MHCSSWFSCEDSDFQLAFAEQSQQFRLALRQIALQLQDSQDDAPKAANVFHKKKAGMVVETEQPALKGFSPTAAQRLLEGG